MDEPALNLDSNSREAVLSFSVTDRGQPTYALLYHWVIENGFMARMNPTSWLVYCAIMHHKGKQHIASPGQRRIAKLCGMSLREIKPAIDELAGLGLIENMECGRGRKASEYKMATRPKGKIMYKPKFKKEIPDNPGQNFLPFSVTTPTRSVTMGFQAENVVSACEIKARKAKAGKTRGNETKDYPSGNPTNNLDEDYLKVQNRANRLRAHLVQVNRSLAYRVRYQDLISICETWDGNTITGVIQAVGKYARTIGLIYQELNLKPTIEQKRQAELARQAKDAESRRARERAEADCMDPEQSRLRFAEARKAMATKKPVVAHRVIPLPKRQVGQPSPDDIFRTEQERQRQLARLRAGPP